MHDVDASRPSETLGSVVEFLLPRGEILFPRRPALYGSKRRSLPRGYFQA